MGGDCAERLFKCQNNVSLNAFQMTLTFPSCMCAGVTGASRRVRVKSHSVSEMGKNGSKVLTPLALWLLEEITTLSFAIIAS